MQDNSSKHYITYVPGPFALKVISKIHTAIYKMSSGRLGQRLDGLDILLLTTQGRTSGRQHQTPMPYFNHPEGHLLIASNAGSTSNPAWYYNLIDHPNTSVRLRANNYQVVASILDAETREYWWQKLIVQQPRYAEYQVKTTRIIPLILLKSRHQHEPF